MYETVELQLNVPHTECAGGVASTIPRPDPVTVRLPSGVATYTLRQVLEAAAEQDESYQFSLLYFTDEYGYVLEGINGTTDDGYCEWVMYYQAPSTDRPTPDYAAPTFMGRLQVDLVDSIEPDTVIVMNYLHLPPPPTPDEPTDPTTQPTEEETEPPEETDPPVVVPTSTTSSPPTTSTSQSSTSTTSSQVGATDPTNVPTPGNRNSGTLGLSMNTHIFSLIVSTTILCVYLV